MEKKRRHAAAVGATLIAVLAALGIPFTYETSASPAGDPTASLGQHRTEWHVSPHGRGSVCTRLLPCQLSTAQEQVRSTTQHMRANLEVLLHDGVYAIPHTWTLGPEDSGRNGYDVIYAAAPGASPMLSGGEQIRGWKLVDAANDIWQADVGSLETRQLYADGVRIRRAVNVPAIPGSVTRIDAGLHTTSTEPQQWRAPTDIELVWQGLESGAFHWVEARCRVSRIHGDTDGTEITIAEPCLDNADAAYGVNVPGGSKALGTPSWAENSPTFLTDDTKPGRWALQRSPAGNRILYRARTGHDPRTLNIIAAQTPQPLVQIQGIAEEAAHNIVVRGLRLSYATWLHPDTDLGYPETWGNYYSIGPEPGVLASQRGALPPGALELDRTHDITVGGNVFDNLGAWAIRIESSKNDDVTGNVMRNLSGGGIMIGRFPPSHQGQTEDILVADNVIENVGVEYGGASGVLLNLARYTTVRNNFIANTGYSGIAMGGNQSTMWRPEAIGETAGNKVLDNYISDVLRRTTDGGGIYDGFPQGDSYDTGLLVEGNVVRHATPDFFGIALYTDIESDFTIHRNNVAYDFAAATGGCNYPHLRSIKSVGNFVDQIEPYAPCGGPLIDVTFDNRLLDPDDPEAACDAMTRCARIVAQAGLRPGYAHLLDAVYSFDDVPTFENVTEPTLPVDGVHTAVDFGRGQWVATYETSGYKTTTHARLVGPRETGSVELARGLALKSITLEGWGRFVLDDGGRTVRGWLPGPGIPVHVRTGFTSPGATVEVDLQRAGQAIFVDDLEVAAVAHGGLP